MIRIRLVEGEPGAPLNGLSWYKDAHVVAAVIIEEFSVKGSNMAPPDGEWVPVEVYEDNLVHGCEELVIEHSTCCLHLSDSGIGVEVASAREDVGNDMCKGFDLYELVVEFLDGAAGDDAERLILQVLKAYKERFDEVTDEDPLLRAFLKLEEAE